MSDDSVAIVFKTIDKNQYLASVSRTTTILSLKDTAIEKIPNCKKEDNISFVCRGKILKAEQTLEEIIAELQHTTDDPIVLYTIIQRQNTQPQNQPGNIGNNNNNNNNGFRNRVFNININLNTVLAYFVGLVFIVAILYSNSLKRTIITGIAVGIFFLLKYLSERRSDNNEHPGYILPFFYSLFPGYQIPNLQQHEHNEQNEDNEENEHDHQE